MKKLLLTLCLFVVSASPAVADYMFDIKQPVALTASGAAMTGAGYLKGFIVNTDGTNNVTLVVYDNTSGSGTVILASMVFDASKQRVYALTTPLRIPFAIGCYFSITCAGTTSVVPFVSSGD